MPELISFITFLLAIFALLVCLAFVFKLKQYRRRLDENHHQLELLQKDMQALYTGAAGMGNHLARIESRIHNLSDRQEKLDDHDLVGQNFSEAIELAQRGVGIDDLMQRCGLIREEAELLIRLHSKSH